MTHLLTGVSLFCLDDYRIVSLLALLLVGSSPMQLA
uniref:Uncharacterized protein n=1 Tax=Rhizophora mucronata TaxID=61149 RepID=A0A2P2QTW6_RHIMU